MLLISLGMGHVFVPLSSTALLGVPNHDAGAASALVNTMQQVGGSLGVAFLNTIATSATTSYAASHGRVVAGGGGARLHLGVRGVGRHHGDRVAGRCDVDPPGAFWPAGRRRDGLRRRCAARATDDGARRRLSRATTSPGRPDYPVRPSGGSCNAFGGMVKTD